MFGVQPIICGTKAWFNQDSGIEYHTDDPLHELYGLLGERLAPVLDHRFDLSQGKDSMLRHQLEALAAVRGRSLSLMPEASVMRLDEADGTTRYFSLLDKGTVNRPASRLKSDPGYLNS